MRFEGKPSSKLKKVNKLSIYDRQTTVGLQYKRNEKYDFSRLIYLNFLVFVFRITRMTKSIKTKLNKSDDQTNYHSLIKKCI